MSTTVSLAEFTSASTIPTLASDGSNWMIFETRFTIAAKSKGVWDHFDGSSTAPVLSNPPTAAEHAALEAWNKNEDTALHILYLKLEDTMVVKVKNYVTAAEHWAFIKQDVTTKSVMLLASLRNGFLAKRCNPKADLHKEFDDVRFEHERIAGLGVIISDDDYRTMIINFVDPHPWLSTFISQMTTGQDLQSVFLQQFLALNPSLIPGATQAATRMPSINPDTLIRLTLLEWDRHQGQKQAKKEKETSTGVAAAASTSLISSEKPGEKQGGAKGNRGKGKESGSKLTCWNCGGTGHKSPDCPSPKDGKGGGKGKNSKGKSKSDSKGSDDAAKANTAKLDEVAGAWSTFVDADVIEEILAEAEEFASSSEGHSTPDSTADLFDYGELTEASESVTSESVDSIGSMPPLEAVSDSAPSEYSDDPVVESSGESELSVDEYDEILRSADAVTAPWAMSIGDALEEMNLAHMPEYPPAPPPSPVSLSEVSVLLRESEGGDPLSLWELNPRLQTIAEWATEVADSTFESEPEGDDIDDLIDDAERREQVFAAIEELKRNDPTVEVEMYDSGCSHHMSPYRKTFSTFKEIAPRNLSAANQQKFTAEGVGRKVIDVPNGPTTSKFELPTCLYAPALAFTLISIAQLDDKGFKCTFGDQKLIISDKVGKVVGIIPKVAGGLYTTTKICTPTANVAADHIPLMEAHRRLAHIAPSSIKEGIRSGKIRGIVLTDLVESQCKDCIEAKSQRKAISKIRQGERATVFGGEIHTDIWGKARTATAGKRYYYISFTDDWSRWTTIYLLRQKSEAFDAYKSFETWVKNHRGVAILIMRADRGGEYLDDDFIRYLDEHGTSRKLTIHDTPEDNGVSERLNRTLAEKMRAMLIASGLPRALWGEAILHAVWLKNRSPTKALEGLTPYELVYEIAPDLSGVPVWGTKVWVQDKSTGKVGKRAVTGRWVGYDMHSNGHRIYFPGAKGGLGKVNAERNVTFSENEDSLIPFPEALDGPLLEGEVWPLVKSTVPSATTTPPAPPKSSPATSPPPAKAKLPAEDNSLTEDEHSDASDAPDVPPEPAPLRRGTRDRKPTQYMKDIKSGEGAKSNFRRDQGVLPKGMQTMPNVDAASAMVDDVDGIALAAVMSETEGLAPQNFAEAKHRADWPQWIDAMEYEIRALERHGTWTIEKVPEGFNVIGCRWVFDIKRDALGSIVRYRARLVAQGFSQVDGKDFWINDLYAPVAKNASVRTVLAMAARRDYEIDQVDIKSAYLYGDLDKGEVLYMKVPPLPNGVDLVLPAGITKADLAAKGSGLVLRLKKPLYGLRQSGRRFYKKLLEVLKGSLRVDVCDVDQAVFFRVEGEDVIVIVAHVDDLTLVTSSVALMREIKAGLRTQFEITDLGAIHWILGIRVRRDRNLRTLSLSQTSYISTIVEKFFGADLKPLAMPMVPNSYLTKSQSPQSPQEVEIMKSKPYREAVGSLMYAATGTRPDIAYAVSIVSKFLENPGMAHWNAVKRIFQYLHGTKDLELTYGAKELSLVGYSDADGSMHEERKAMSGYAFLIDGGAVSWRSKQQEIIALSTTEAEYVGYTHATKEALWLRSFIGQIFGEFDKPTELFGDNQSAIALAKDQQYHARTKHIDIRYHFIRWVISEGKVKLVYCPTEDMVADTLTKALPSPKVKHFASALGLSKD